ncbi:MAG TPA: hypothetical protein V6C65_03110 [Allocoleopsis sp.]
MRFTKMLRIRLQIFALKHLPLFRQARKIYQTEHIQRCFNLAPEKALS